MARDERFDIVIVGGGPNGMTTAAYLAKCGLSVCVLEERTESGGACESVEPLPGVRIFPHAVLMYASPAPGFEQLELHKYGFRMDWSPVDPLVMNTAGMACTDGWRPITEDDQLGWATLAGMMGDTNYTKELMRAAFWCPPHPASVEVTDENTPYMQVYKKYQPELWTPELRQGTMFDIMDEHLDSEQFKTAMAFAAWASGAAGHWEGVAIPAILAVHLLTLPNLGRLSTPRGGMHGYFHSILRCAVHKGAVIRTSSPVDEVLIEDGRAVGVRLRETAASGGRTIRANKAVILACDVHQAFLKMVGPKHLDPDVLQKIEDISLKNQTLYVSTFHTKEPLRFNERFKDVPEEAKLVGPDRQPSAGVYPCDSREIYYENVADVDGHKGQPTVPAERAMWFHAPPQAFDVTQAQGSYPQGYISGQFEMAVTSPDLHVEGEDALDTYKEEMDRFMRECISQVLDGLDDDNVLHHWSASGRDVEFRNTGLIGGTWCGSRHDEDQLWTNRPTPELARYRSPIENLYHAHQTSGHPGALCLMAIPYNLMHILIEDGIAEPGDWWYASPYYIAEEGKIPANKR